MFEQLNGEQSVIENCRYIRPVFGFRPLAALNFYKLPNLKHYTHYYVGFRLPLYGALLTMEFGMDCRMSQTYIVDVFACVARRFFLSADKPKETLNFRPRTRIYAKLEPPVDGKRKYWSLRLKDTAGHKQLEHIVSHFYACLSSKHVKTYDMKLYNVYRFYSELEMEYGQDKYSYLGGSKGIKNFLQSPHLHNIRYLTLYGTGNTVLYEYKFTNLSHK